MMISAWSGRCSTRLGTPISAKQVRRQGRILKDTHKAKTLMANLGFVGLGAMGSRITKRLLAKGHTVTGYDLFPAKQPELVAMGGTWASSPRAVCEAADT